MNYKRRTKDSVFTKVFGEAEYALMLYKTFHPEDTEATEDQLKIITLENVFTNGFYNDLGLLVNGRLMIFVEAQSAWSPNMPIRTLLYLSETYKRHFIENELDIHSGARLTIPTPEVYVIYTGERAERPDTMRLSEHFAGNRGPGTNSLELIVKMIYDGKEGDIVYQYVNFCKVFDSQVSLYPDDRKRAIRETLRICTDKALLDRYIRKHESEVYDIMSDYIFNEEVLMRIHIASEKRIARNEGLAEGIEVGLAKGVQKKALETARNALAMGLPTEQIVRLTNLSEEEVLSLR